MASPLNSSIGFGEYMLITNDHEAQMSYLTVRPDASVHRTVVLEEDSVIVDYDRDGAIVGIELFDTVRVQSA